MYKDMGRTTLHSLALQPLPPAPQRALQVALAERLLQQGVAIDAVMAQGSSALEMAVGTGNLDMTVKDQTDDIFGDYGVHKSEFRVGGPDPVMKDACQYDESDYNYVHRRWEEKCWFY